MEGMARVGGGRGRVGADMRGGRGEGAGKGSGGDARAPGECSGVVLLPGALQGRACSCGAAVAGAAPRGLWGGLGCSYHSPASSWYSVSSFSLHPVLLRHHCNPTPLVGALGHFSKTRQIL